MLRAAMPNAIDCCRQARTTRVRGPAPVSAEDDLLAAGDRDPRSRTRCWRAVAPAARIAGPPGRPTPRAPGERCAARGALPETGRRLDSSPLRRGARPQA